jgi:predicted  nucleic acid-binding Zn-ribbon protein
MKVFFLWSLLIIIASTFFLKIQRESINETSAIFKKRHSGINFIQLLLKEGDSEKSNSSPEETNSTETESDNQTNSDNETEEVDYDILDNENYGEEVKDMRNSISQSGNRTIDKIKENTERLKQKIDNVTHALEDKINNFTERIINKSKELDKLMLFNELKLLKLAVQILKSQVNEIISEIFRLKNLLAKLLENFPSSIKTICNLYKSCGDCLRNKYCGWCQEQEKCMLGDDKGPRFDLCQFYAYEKCEANNCLKYLNCSVFVYFIILIYNLFMKELSRRSILWLVC